MTRLRPKVVLADDTPTSLGIWKNLLQETCTVVATAGDGPSALDAIRTCKPDVAVLDINMPGLSGLDVARAAITEQSGVGVILCSVMRNPAIIQAAVDAGVRGYVFKMNLFNDLATAVSTVATGGKFIPLLDPAPFLEPGGESASGVSQEADDPDLTQMVQALRESEKRLRFALEANSEGVWDWNIQSGQAYFSDCYARMLGYEPEEFPTDYAEWKQLVHPEDFDRVHQAHADHIYGGKEFCVEFRMRKKTGDWCWIRSRATVIERDGAGAAIRMVGTHLDITERKRIEEELRNREWEFREAQRVARVGSWTRDRNDVLKWSDEMYRIHGRARSLPPPSFEELEHLFTPESWQRLKATREQARESGSLPNEDFEIVRPDGSHGWISTRGEVECDENGRMVRVRGTVQDITEWKQVEQKLREYEQAIEGVEEMIVVVDREFRFVIANRAFLNFHHQTADRVIGQSVPEIVNKEVFENVIKPNLEKSFRGQPVHFELTFTYPEYGSRTVFATHLPIDGPHGVERVVAILQDVTERKKAEEELRGIGGRLIQAQEQERKRIARELHDDINQQIAMLGISVQQLRLTPGLTPSQVDQQLEELFRQTADISQGIQAVSHQLHSSSLDYLGLAAAIKGFCDELSRHHKVTISYEYRDVPRSLSPDISLALFRVTQEALQNAIKYSGVREFTVQLVGSSDEVQLSVRDQGVGFGPEGAIHGRGLGLISMRERVVALHGKLSIISKPKHGTEIIASVPFIPPAKGTAS